MSRKNNIILLLLFVSLLNTSVFSQMFGQEPTERVRTYDVKHITIDVKLDLEKKTVEGRTITTIVPLNNSFTSFDVDAVGMEINRVLRVQRGIPGIEIYVNEPKPKDLTFNYDKNKITVILDREYSTFDSITYIVEYSTTDPEKGMYFISPTPTFPNKPYQVWTQGEGEDNRYWFPCYDYPNDMATTEMTITVDSKYQTISNGVLKDKEVNGNITTWHWVNDKPHVSYLVMLGIGNWDTISTSWDRIPIISYVPPGKKSWGQNSYRQTADIMKFFSEYIDFRYPWGEFRQVAVQDFIYGGMENTGAVVLFEGSVYDEKTEPDYNATNLVAHELAHQWWGDIVTCSNWNEIWLNESFATYFQCLYTEHLLGKDEFDYNIYRNGRDAIKADSTTARKPIYTREGLTVNTYDKGSVVLNMLRNLIGDEKFRKAMNIYITENKHKPVVTKNLVDAVHKAIDENVDITMPANLGWFFEEWIYKAGQPEIEASYTYNESTGELTITAKQIQRLDSSSVFRTPFKYEIITSSGSQTLELFTGTEPKSHKVKVDYKPLCVIFNKGNGVLCKLYFTKPKTDWLYQLKYSTDAIDRITALKGLKDFIDDDDVVSSVLSAAQSDKFWGVRYEAAQLLSYSKNKNAQDNYITSLVDEKDSRVRRSFILGLGNFYDNYPELRENSGVLSSFLINLANHETSYYAAADAVTTLEKILNGAELYENVLPYLEKDSHSEVIRRSTIAAIDSSNDPRSVDVLLYWAEYGSIARLRNTAINGLSSFADDPRVMDFLNYKLINSPRSTQNTILGIIEKQKSPDSKPFLVELITKSNDVKFKEKVNKILEVIK